MEPIPPLHYLERYRNEGTRTYSRHAAYTEAEDGYRPDSLSAGFQLPLFKLPTDRLNICTANPPRELAASYLDDSWTWFCIHPQMLKECPDEPYVRRTLSLSTDCRTVTAVPSSSTRTLYIEDQANPHAVKVHFPFRISRYTRKMRGEVLEQAVNVSRELEIGVEALDASFAFLREVIAVSHKDLQPDTSRGENWGYLVRDLSPFPGRESSGPLVPGFALYGKDFFNPQTPLLLFDLIRDCDPLTYVLDNIMLPIIRHWVGCFLDFGFLLEPHGQNVLLELNNDHTVRRVVHRDLSVGIDMRRRRDIDLSSSNLNNYNRTDQPAFHSVTYDRFMGGHFFDRIVAACLDNYPSLTEEQFTRPCREEFARIFPEYDHYFPETVWYFSEKRDRYNKPYYEDTGISPTWRP